MRPPSSASLSLSRSSQELTLAGGSSTSQCGSGASPFALQAPSRAHLERLLTLRVHALQRASVDIVEPAYFKHAAAFLSAPERNAWTSTRLRISLAAFDSIPALVAHLREALAPYFGSAADRFPARGVVVELTDWSATLAWRLDDLDAAERTRGMGKDAFEALKTSRRCQGWGDERLVRPLSLSLSLSRAALPSGGQGADARVFAAVHVVQAGGVERAVRRC